MTPSREQDDEILIRNAIKAFNNFCYQSGLDGVDIPRVTESEWVACWKLATDEARLSSPSVPDGWILAMQVLQSDLYHKLDDEERSICDALIAQNPYAKAQPPLTPSRSEGPLVSDVMPFGSIPPDAQLSEPPSHHSGAVVDALRELVALKDLKDANTINGAWQYEEAEADYTKRKRMAWENARLALRHPSSTGAEE